MDAQTTDSPQRARGLEDTLAALDVHLADAERQAVTVLKAVRRLLAAVPIPDPRRRDHSIELDDSEVPSPLRQLDDPPIVAPLVRVGDDHFVARHRVGGLY